MTLLLNLLMREIWSASGSDSKLRIGSSSSGAMPCCHRPSKRPPDSRHRETNRPKANAA